MKIPFEERISGFGKLIVRWAFDFRRQVILKTIYYIICTIAFVIRIVISVLNSSDMIKINKLNFYISDKI